MGLPLTYRVVDFMELGLPDGDLPRISAICLPTSACSGCNVTYPFKQSVIARCDSLSEPQPRWGRSTRWFSQMAKSTAKTPTGSAFTG